MIHGKFTLIVYFDIKFVCEIRYLIIAKQGKKFGNDRLQLVIPTNMVFLQGILFF